VYKQLLTPVGDNLGLSFAVAALPILVVLIGRGRLRSPDWSLVSCWPSPSGA
jgi:lactate permease